MAGTTRSGSDAPAAAQGPSGQCLPADARWLFHVPTIQEVHLQCQRLLAMPLEQRPTALICVDQHWPIAEVLVRLGVQIPAQISLIGIGHPMPWMMFTRSWPEGVIGRTVAGQPSDVLDSRLAPLRSMVFSAVSLPFREMGAWTMQEILRRLAQPGASADLKVFGGALVPGTTIAPPPD